MHIEYFTETFFSTIVALALSGTTEYYWMKISEKMQKRKIKYT